MTRFDPGSNASVEFVVEEPEGDQSIHIEQVDHGKFAKISSTSLLLNVGAFGPALRAGSPVTGSVTSFAQRVFSSQGANHERSRSSPRPAKTEQNVLRRCTGCRRVRFR